jgi:hypothetical protein
VANRPWSYMGPPVFAHLAFACPACLAAAPVFVGGSRHAAYFVCNACGLDFDLRASDAEADVIENLD